MSDRKNEISITSPNGRKNRGIKDRKNKKYECDVCVKRFTNTNHLVEHQRIHAEQKPHECDICQKSYSVKSSLNYSA